eukprot:jgi/Ulvmu1/482/UM001_0490.1
MKSGPTDQQRAVFIALQPVLQQLLPAANDPDRLRALLKTFHDLLNSTPFICANLNSCFDYVWLPFQYMLASLAQSRKLRDLPPKPTAQGAAPVPAMASQLAAERAMQSIQAILAVAGPADLSSLLTILTPLAELTHLDPASCNEHIMLAVLASTSAILARIPTALQKPAAVTPESHASWAVTAGLLFHGLLAITEAERSGNGHGAPKLATAALRASDSVVQALDTQPDRVAFYLPGLVSKATALLTDSPSTLPPSSHTAACCMLRSVLTSALDPATLPPGAMRAAHAEGQHGGSGAEYGEWQTPQAALHALSAAVAGDVVAPAHATGAAEEEAPVATRERPFSCARDAAWLQDTTATLRERLEAALVALRGRKSAKTRAASATMAASVLRTCSPALGRPLTLLLTRHMLLLSRDSAPAVAEPCMALMHDLAQASCGPSDNLALVQRCVAEISSQAVQQLQRGTLWLEADLCEHCDALASALAALPPQQALQDGPGTLLGLVGRLLEVDVATAALWLQGGNSAAVPGGGALVARSSTASNAAVQSLLVPEAAGSGAGEGGEEGAGGQHGGAAVAGAARAAAATALASVPRGSGARGEMPPGLKMMQTVETFRAVQGVARALGGACAELARGGDVAGEGDGGQAAVAAVDAARVQVEEAAPLLRRPPAGGDVMQPEGLLLQTRALAAWAAFMQGCAEPPQRRRQGHTPQPHQGGAASGGARQDTEGHGRNPSASVPAADGNDSGAPADESLWAVLRLGTRSIIRAACKALQAGEQAVAAVSAVADADAAGAGGGAEDACARELRTAAAVHAHALAAATAALAESAPAAVRGDPAVLRAVLLPLLQTAASGPPFVAAEASAAISALCTCLGHADWPELVSTNLDYVVDGLMKQIQNPDLYPHSPHLLAALFSSSHVTRTLLPALAEPAAAAVQRLSIFSRAAHPRHTAAFLQALAPVATAAAQEGAVLRDAARAAVAAVQSRAEAADAAAQHAHHERSVRAEAAAGLAADSVDGYFTAYDSNAAASGETDDAAASTQHAGVKLTAEETAALEARRWATYSAAELASSVCAASAPLLVSEDLRVALAAHATVTEALVAMSHLTDADDSDGRELVEGLGLKHLAPLPGEPERLLPQVHATWGFMLPGLRSRSEAPRVEAALRLLVRVAQLAGSFISRRFKTDALPALRPLLRGAAAVGVRARPGGGAVVEHAAVGKVARCQGAALRAVVAMCEDGGSAAVVEGAVEVAEDAVEAMCCALGAGQAGDAVAAVRALARVDADAVWLRVHRAAAQGGAQVRGVCKKLLGDVEGMEVRWHAAFLKQCEAVEQAIAV